MANYSNGPSKLVAVEVADLDIVTHAEVGLRPFLLLRSTLLKENVGR